MTEDRLITLPALTTRIACGRMTEPQLKVLRHSVEQAACLPASFWWEGKVTAWLSWEAMTIKPGMTMAIANTQQAVENMEYVRRLLKQKQPGFAAALELAAALAEQEQGTLLGVAEADRPGRRPAGRS